MVVERLRAELGAEKVLTDAAALESRRHAYWMLSQLDAAYDRAARGVVPEPLPCEIYCHSLSDPTILSEQLRASGAQTLTVFGLHAPHDLMIDADPDHMRTRLTDAVLASLDSVLAEPIRTC
jgi:phytoene dehydrogenase-like protein